MHLVRFLADLLCLKKLLQNFEENFLFFMISASWSVNFQMTTFLYQFKLCLYTKYSSSKKVAC